MDTSMNTGSIVRIHSKDIPNERKKLADKLESKDFGSLKEVYKCEDELANVTQQEIQMQKDMEIIEELKGLMTLSGKLQDFPINLSKRKGVMLLDKSRMEPIFQTSESIKEIMDVSFQTALKTAIEMQMNPGSIATLAFTQDELTMYDTLKTLEIKLTDEGNLQSLKAEKTSGEILTYEKGCIGDDKSTKTFKNEEDGKKHEISLERDKHDVIFRDKVIEE
jgi:hypothetical protein